VGELHGNQAIEAAAIRWVMDLEVAAGREPVDRRFERAFPGDVESPPRIIEVKASYRSYRGWFLPLQPIQVERGLADPHFCIYVVENVAQGDPALFTIKVLAGDRLRRLLTKAVARTSYEVPWPVAEYEDAPTGLEPD
jgi:hypothetical protein